MSEQQVIKENGQDQNQQQPIFSHSMDKQKSKILSKIELMRQSVSQMNVLDGCKPIDNLRKLQFQRENLQHLTQKEQRKMLSQLNLMQNNLLQIQKQKMKSNITINNSREDILQKILNHDEDLKRNYQQNIEKIDQFRDNSMNLKIKIVQLEASCKQKIEKTERDIQYRLINCEKIVDNLKKNDSQHEDAILGQLKKLKNCIEDQKKINHKEQKKYRGLINDLKKDIDFNLSLEQTKQKQGFQQNYKALEQVFMLLSQQFYNKQ